MFMGGYFKKKANVFITYIIIGDNWYCLSEEKYINQI